MWIGLDEYTSLQQSGVYSLLTRSNVQSSCRCVYILLHNVPYRLAPFRRSEKCVLETCVCGKKADIDCIVQGVFNSLHHCAIERKVSRFLSSVGSADCGSAHDENKPSRSVVPLSLSTVVTWLDGAPRCRYYTHCPKL